MSDTALLDAAAQEIVDEELALARRVQQALAARIATRGRGGLPDPAAPYFGHLVLQLADRRRELLVGDSSWLDPGDGLPAIAAWRTAPLARLLFNCRQGDDFEEEINGRPLSGVVQVRRLLDFGAGALRQIAASEIELARGADGGWHCAPTAIPALAGAETGWRGPIDRDALDAEQRAVLERAPDGAALINGPAGSGKTTAAVHRLAHHAARHHRGRLRSLVVVPELGLADLTSARLRRLGLPDASVVTYSQWARQQARRHFPSIARRLSDDASPAVMRVKRHPALRQVLREFVARRAAPLDRLLDDLPLLFGERRWLERLAELAQGEVRPGDVEETLLHTRRQLDERSEEAYAHVARSRRRAVDGRDLDDGTPDQIAGGHDIEDVAVLLELLWLRRGAGATASGQRAPLDHLVIDEVQDVAPIELAALARTVTPEGALTLAGDDAQHVDPTAPRPDWDALAAAAGVASDRRFGLRHSHRCPAPVLELAHSILGAQPPPGPAPRPGPPVVVTGAGSSGLLAARLADGLAAFCGREEQSEVALVCRNAAGAHELHALIEPSLPAQLVLDGKFPFKPGLVITEVRAVRGLEFDLVVIPDADAAHYPRSDETAALLHLATSRARHQLWLLWSGWPSPLLPERVVGTGA
ncbi:MAG: AAA family ATPase [Deltaproteobacteria bacterium]|nr:AAA family ATPase [Deltaproteobacteria bacterium]